MSLACQSSQKHDSDTNDTTHTIDNPVQEETQDAYQITKSISYNDIEVDVLIDKPEGKHFDILLVYHGTVWYDSEIQAAAQQTLNEFIRILGKDDLMIISVAYPEENLLFGDNLAYAEAALLWVQNSASQDLEIEIDRVFLGGHSQGGYLVTRLNTMHETDGVIANCPGPLNLVYRCGLEENNQIQSSNQCTQLQQEYGFTTENPEPYAERSLLHFTTGHRSPIIFVQGMQDADVQLYSWPIFKEQMSQCEDCQEMRAIEIEEAGHGALFESIAAQEQIKIFID